MVFQSYALYPHMTVEENMGFGLKMTGHPESEIKARVGRAAEILHLEPLLKRKPKQLSGGQRQRVAIGRAIVRQPEIFLFDEPCPISMRNCGCRCGSRLPSCTRSSAPP
jgi:lactose/L-arabinose transport system ATP-binding protein